MDTKDCTLIHIKRESHARLKDYCKKNGLKMITALETAIHIYLANQTEYDTHRAQALDKTRLFEEMYEYIKTIENGQIDKNPSL